MSKPSSLNQFHSTGNIRKFAYKCLSFCNTAASLWFFQVTVFGPTMIGASRPLTRMRMSTAVTVPRDLEVVGGLPAVSKVTWTGYTSLGVIPRLWVRASSGSPGKATSILSNVVKWKLDQTSDVNGVIGERWNEQKQKTAVMTGHYKFWNSAYVSPYNMCLFESVTSKL